MRTARVDRLPMSGPAEMSAIAALLGSGDAAADNVVAILDKTEGNGCVNDFVRGYAVQSLRAVLVGCLDAAQDQLVAVLAKAEASPDGVIRRRHHTMLDDSDISSPRHAGGFVGGVLAGLTDMTDLFVSGGAEHQGPPGGGPVAIIYRKENNT